MGRVPLPSHWQRNELVQAVSRLDAPSTEAALARNTSCPSVIERQGRKYSLLHEATAAWSKQPTRIDAFHDVLVLLSRVDALRQGKVVNTAFHSLADHSNKNRGFLPLLSVVSRRVRPEETQVRCVKLLIEHFGADVNLVHRIAKECDMKENALGLALLFSDSPAIVRTLLEAGANVNSRMCIPGSKFSMHPLVLAVYAVQQRQSWWPRAHELFPVVLEYFGRELPQCSRQQSVADVMLETSRYMERQHVENPMEVATQHCMEETVRYVVQLPGCAALFRNCLELSFDAVNDCTSSFRQMILQLPLPITPSAMVCCMRRGSIDEVASVFDRWLANPNPAEDTCDGWEVFGNVLTAFVMTCTRRQCRVFELWCQCGFQLNQQLWDASLESFLDLPWRHRQSAIQSLDRRRILALLVAYDCPMNQTHKQALGHASDSPQSKFDEDASRLRAALGPQLARLSARAMFADIVCALSSFRRKNMNVPVELLAEIASFTMHSEVMQCTAQVAHRALADQAVRSTFKETTVLLSVLDSGFPVSRSEPLDQNTRVGWLLTKTATILESGMAFTLGVSTKCLKWRDRGISAGLEDGLDDATLASVGDFVEVKFDSFDELRDFVGGYPLKEVGSRLYFIDAESEQSLALCALQLKLQQYHEQCNFEPWTMGQYLLARIAVLAYKREQQMAVSSPVFERLADIIGDDPCSVVKDYCVPDMSDTEEQQVFDDLFANVNDESFARYDSYYCAHSCGEMYARPVLEQAAENSMSLVPVSIGDRATVHAISSGHCASVVECSVQFPRMFAEFFHSASYEHVHAVVYGLAWRLLSETGQPHRYLTRMGNFRYSGDREGIAIFPAVALPAALQCVAAAKSWGSGTCAYDAVDTRMPLSARGRFVVATQEKTLPRLGHNKDHLAECAAFRWLSQDDEAPIQTTTVTAIVAIDEPLVVDGDHTAQCRCFVFVPIHQD
ncbi:MAG: hypothetical protein MHM6MM_006306 [Cercozoa sp. M6MM]